MHTILVIRERSSVDTDVFSTRFLEQFPGTFSGTVLTLDGSRDGSAKMVWTCKYDARYFPERF